MNQTKRAKEIIANPKIELKALAGTRSVMNAPRNAPGRVSRPKANPAR